MPSDEMWRQSQLRPADPDAWLTDPANVCKGCGRATTAGEFLWIWGTGRRTSMALRGLYCLDCGVPAGEPQGADIAGAVRRSTASAR
jgi:hypothetical protein